MEDKWVCHWNYYTIARSNLLQITISGMPWPRLRWQYRSLITTSASGIVQCFICHWISVFRFDLPHRRKFTHAHVCVNIECNFSAKSFTLKNLSSLTNFQKLSAVSNNICIAHFYWKILCLSQLKLPIAGSRADPAGKCRGGDFSNIWQSSLRWQPSVFLNCTKSWWKMLLS